MTLIDSDIDADLEPLEFAVSRNLNGASDQRRAECVLGVAPAASAPILPAFSVRR